ncbi:STM4504/CBY_0614 family protein [Aeromonas dhakensis]|uniref:STM4504/CBY_0614 family protein n=1 Tax=Aeromonas dhakensis TaxID=196024 RepID=UPI0038B4D77E
MAVYEIYSKRQKRLRGEFNDVYQYDEIPSKLRVQISKIYDDIFNAHRFFMNRTLNSINEILTREYGVDSLNYNSKEINIYSDKSREAQVLLSFSKSESNTECFLDVLELIIEAVKSAVKQGMIQFDIQDAIEEINIRFRENSVGYQLDSDSLTIIRVDSQFVHSEVVRPTLTLLNADPAYAGALDEFMLAHEHYRHQNFKDAILNCGKSFESMLKAIHEKRGWAYDKHKDTANKLILSCVDKGLFPSFQQDQLMQVGKVLECGVPTIRNKTAGHGQGHEVIEVPEHLVSYMIHLTATNLLFLAKSDEACV